MRGPRGWASPREHRNQPRQQLLVALRTAPLVAGLCVYPTARGPGLFRHHLFFWRAWHVRLVLQVGATIYKRGGLQQTGTTKRTRFTVE